MHKYTIFNERDTLREAFVNVYVDNEFSLGHSTRDAADMAINIEKKCIYRIRVIPK